MKHDSISKLITYRDIIHRSTSDRHFKKVVPQKKPFFKKRFDNRILAKGESNDITDSDEEYDDEGNEECDEEDDEEDADSCENDSSTTSAAKSNQVPIYLFLTTTTKKSKYISNLFFKK